MTNQVTLSELLAQVNNGDAWCVAEDRGSAAKRSDLHGTLTITEFAVNDGKLTVTFSGLQQDNRYAAGSHTETVDAATLDICKVAKHWDPEHPEYLLKSPKGDRRQDLWLVVRFRPTEEQQEELRKQAQRRRANGLIEAAVDMLKGCALGH